MPPVARPEEHVLSNDISETTRAFGLPNDPQAILSGHIGRLIRLAFRQFEIAVLKHLRDLGFEDLRLTHVQMLPYIPVSGIRTSEIAAAANMTKQAVGQLANEMENAGYIRRTSDPSDGRAKLVTFTDKGLTLSATYPIMLARSEADLLKGLSLEEFHTFRKVIARMANVDLSE
ncbi:MarR family winged helix-turn-helix transcriptional regulator [Sphingobium sp.]|uniref:MarR family winged helix-turn-helix transcriptional regulator n=1 Tax=Sphingobium sp. TaxID=1912891 RepID=UPI0028BE9036|nr:MarR family winged helix-turn-helix transcriptional regulator [Sphingobium sp.]